MVQKRSRLTQLDDVPGGVPKAVVPEDVDSDSVRSEVLKQLANLTLEDLTEHALWRDFMGLTGTLRTLSSRDSVFDAFGELRRKKQARDFTPGSLPSAVVRMSPESSWIDLPFKFVTTEGGLTGQAAGYVSVIPNLEAPGQWKIWMLRTWLNQFEGHGDPDVLKPNQSKVTNGTNGHATSGTPTRKPSHDVVIIGAGQSGLSCAGRLKALGISSIILERNNQIGDNWRNRYKSLKWHTSKDYGHLPFDRTYLPDDPYLLTAQNIGDGFQRFAEKFDLDVKLRTSVQSSKWDSDAQRWTVTASTPDGDETFTSKYLILAVGGYAGVPVIPDWPGRDRYKGESLHGIDYQSSTQWKGKHGIVVGTANTGHDVAEDMVEAGLASVTMVQRGNTFVFPVEWLHHAQDADYNLDIPTEDGDRLAYTHPYKIRRTMINNAVHGLIDKNSERFDALERAGFNLERKGDILTNLLVRFGGHYIDVGTSKHISEGRIKMKGDSLVSSWTEDGLKFEDGTELKADVVVMCTGYNHDFRPVAEKLVGRENADLMDEFFGLDEEGEIRGAFRQNAHPSLYYAGGDIRQARWYSRFVALSIQAAILGEPLQLYKEK